MRKSAASIVESPTEQSLAIIHCKPDPESVSSLGWSIILDSVFLSYKVVSF